MLGIIHMGSSMVQVRSPAKTTTTKANSNKISNMDKAIKKQCQISTKDLLMRESAMVQE